MSRRENAIPIPLPAFNIPKRVRGKTNHIRSIVPDIVSNVLASFIYLSSYISIILILSITKKAFYINTKVGNIDVQNQKKYNKT